ncbi:MAG: hypothetical protein WCT41_01510 [Candidatus Paceibacterota bacterium]|jgi:hypothetical protein
MRYLTTKIVAGVLITESVVVMTGWIFGVEWMTRLIPIGINMKFITAVLFFFSALGLHAMALSIEKENELARVMLPGIALVIFLITMTLLVSWILGTPTGIEELFVQSAGPINLSNAVSIEGWPSLPTLFGFALFALLGIDALFAGAFRERSIRYAGYFILLTGCFAVIGYMFSLPELYYEFTANSVPMAFNTAACFIVLGFGLTRILNPEESQ